jgi:hypothetical protein
MKQPKGLVKYIKEEHRINQRLSEISKQIQNAHDEGRPSLLSHLRNVRDLLNEAKYDLDSKFPQYQNVFLTSDEINEILNIKD